MKLSILVKMGLAAIAFCIVSTGSVVRAQTVLLEDNFDAENNGIPNAQCPMPNAPCPL
ncbi:MAG: hypothetical protein F6J93_00725 [Oscillatoria sp. SIO1A7]|nr:hypothetical protein [Oscillatoria sp. SIO1A7]